MLLPIRQIGHQKQENKVTCVAACISIVTGISENDICMELMADKNLPPFNMSAAVRLLTRKNIYVEKVGGTIELALLNDRIYLCTCPSSVNPKMAHLVVGVVCGGHMRIIDPADDLKSQKLYNSVDFSKGHIPIFEYYLLTDCSM